MRIKFLCAFVTAFFLLASCGGGSGGDGGENPGTVPPVVEEEDPVAPREPVSERRVALFLVNFTDNRGRFPDSRDIEKNLEEGVVKEYFDDISYGQFTYEIDSFGPFTHQNEFTSLYPHHQLKVLSIDTVDIQGFDADIYDIFVLVSASDYEFEAAITYPADWRKFRVNGEVVNREKRVMVHPLFIGCRKRNCGGSPENKFTEKYFPDSPFTIFQTIFIHEFIHTLGVWGHANSRTNGPRFDYEPEIQNNGGNLNRDYGNPYDIMGAATGENYGYNLNVGYRDFLGWLEPPRKTVIEGYGCFTATVDPINDTEGTVAAEIRIPGKEHRYYLETRDFRDKWDSRSPTPDRQRIVAANRQGVMVNRAEDIPDQEFVPTYLLDMSPSPNRTGDVPDVSDVVLKPGREYDAPDLRLWDVTPRGDNSFSVRIMVKNPDNEPHGSCADF